MVNYSHNINKTNTTSLLNSLITKKDHANYANRKQGGDSGQVQQCGGFKPDKKSLLILLCFITGEIKTQIPTIMVVLPKEV